MELKDEHGWEECKKKNTDPYGNATVVYAERWANAMEIRLAQGEKLVDIAKETSHKANTDGITGFVYGCAVEILAQVWAHGEDLRKWHNLDTQIKDEGARANASGAVLNPAVLVIGGSGGD